MIFIGNLSDAITDVVNEIFGSSIHLLNDHSTENLKVADLSIFFQRVHSHGMNGKIVLGRLIRVDFATNPNERWIPVVETDTDTETVAVRKTQ